MSMDQIDDYFAAEAAIVARLKAEIPAITKVLTPFTITDMLESSQGDLALHVIYSGDVLPGESAGRGAIRPVDQRWLVILAVRCVKAQLQNTTELRTKAGPFVPLILKALQGWAPVEWMRPLSRVPGPAAGYSATFGYFPFMFEGRIIT
jgi:hypothetical protein